MSWLSLLVRSFLEIEIIFKKMIISMFNTYLPPELAPELEIYTIRIMVGSLYWLSFILHFSFGLFIIPYLLEKAYCVTGIWKKLGWIN